MYSVPTFVALDDVLGAAEPYQIYHAVAVGEMRHEHLVALADIDFLVAQDLPLSCTKGISEVNSLI